MNIFYLAGASHEISEYALCVLEHSEISPPKALHQIRKDKFVEATCIQNKEKRATTLNPSSTVFARMTLRRVTLNFRSYG